MKITSLVYCGCWRCMRTHDGETPVRLRGEAKDLPVSPAAVLGSRCQVARPSGAQVSSHTSVVLCTCLLQPRRCHGAQVSCIGNISAHSRRTRATPAGKSWVARSWSAASRS